MIRIEDCGEPLVDIKKACPGVLIALDPWRMEHEKTAYLRQTVATMLKRAQRSLPPGMTFLVRDAWRPHYVQEQIFKEFIERFTKQNPHWLKERVLQEVETYVAQAQGQFASGHMTGGAVDVRLWHKGRRLPMRSQRLSYQENARSQQPKLPAHLQRNRRLMFEALSTVGFSNQPNEFWHWSYGDVQWAQRTQHATAIYGVVTKLPGVML